jgi:type III restriction enzyme
MCRSVTPPSGLLKARAALDYTVEMETGTGKTFVYLRTVFELNQRYGFTKFVVVVPSIAIKEGVNKTLQIRAHRKDGARPAWRVLSPLIGQGSRVASSAACRAV